MREMGRSNLESLFALGGIVHHGHSLSPHKDAQQNGEGVAVDFEGFQPLCISLHTPESFGTQDRVGTPCVAGFGASPKKTLQRPAPSVQYTIICPVDPGTFGRLEGFPSSLGPSLPANSPTPPLPVQTGPWPRQTGQSQSPGSNRTRTPRLDCQPSLGKHTAWSGLARCSRLPGWLHSTLNCSGRRIVHTPLRHPRSPTSPEHATGTNTSLTTPRP